MKFVIAAILATSAAALPSNANDNGNPHIPLVELKLPAPNNYLASDIFKGQQIYVDNNRGHTADWDEETWTNFAKSRCILTPGCSTVNSYHLESEIINGTEKAFWFFELYAGPKSTAADWVHSIFDLTHQRIYTIAFSN